MDFEITLIKAFEKAIKKPFILFWFLSIDIGKFYILYCPCRPKAPFFTKRRHSDTSCLFCDEVSYDITEEIREMQNA